MYCTCKQAGETGGTGSWATHMLSRETVVTGFRLLLGREPESEEVIEAHRPLPDEATLRRALLDSAEFAALYAALEAERAARAGEADSPPMPEGQDILLPAAAIETRVEGDAADRLWARVAGNWAALGGSAPHWSVLTHERFRPERLDAHLPEFVRSGEVEGLLVDAALERMPDLDPARLDCLEIGCGVGRATRALARRFRSVTGADVSAAHLAIAEADFRAEGIANAAFRRVEGIADYAALPEHDFLYSRIVLQHNPPPVQAVILARVFGRLRPGGAALFQVVTAIEGYAYSVGDDLDAATPAMEMHALPQPEVFRLLAESGLAPLEVQEDFAAGDRARHRSHLFLARKG